MQHNAPIRLRQLSQHTSLLRKFPAQNKRKITWAYTSSYSRHVCWLQLRFLTPRWRPTAANIPFTWSWLCKIKTILSYPRTPSLAFYLLLLKGHRASLLQQRLTYVGRLLSKSVV